MLQDNQIPYFCWDRPLSVDDIKRKLKEGPSREWVQMTSLIMREAKFEDVWHFLSPLEVQARLNELLPFLGRKKHFWQYILRRWNELGII